MGYVALIHLDSGGFPVRNKNSRINGNLRIYIWSDTLKFPQIHRYLRQLNSISVAWICAFILQYFRSFRDSVICFVTRVMWHPHSANTPLFDSYWFCQVIMSDHRSTPIMLKETYVQDTVARVTLLAIYDSVLDRCMACAVADLLVTAPRFNWSWTNLSMDGSGS